ncbi:acylphosphatase [archaeon BMS3Bbin15]|nr:acylphosphatase [archaeon BMS3Bbin15]
MKKRVVIFGRVQNVGYRPFLLGIAEGLGIEYFFADNTIINERQAVHIMIDSSQDRVDSFIGIISSKYPENASVDEVKVEDYSGNVMKTESYYRYLTAMQLHKIATFGGIMIEKQDDTVREVRAVGTKVDLVGRRWMLLELN